MTGFGRGEAPLGSATLIVEARAVNHRFCEVRASWPKGMKLKPGLAEDLVKRALSRGRIELAGRLEHEVRENTPIDDWARRLAPLAELRDALDPGGPFPWALAPLLGAEDGPPEFDPAASEEAAEAALRAALKALDTMRAREGDALGDELERLLEAVRARAHDARAEVPLAVERAHTRLRERVATLLEGRDVPLEPARLELEIALLADRADVTEELARLDAHVAQFESLLDDDEPVGRRLEFLLQEMGREVNTLGSKSADGTLSRTVVELKSLLEKLREQVQNVL